MNLKKRKGFGLPLEIIIVLAVGGVLYGMAVVAYRSIAGDRYETKEMPLYIRMENGK